LLERFPIRLSVIAGLVPAISIRKAPCDPDRDGRNKSGHDNKKCQPKRKALQGG
jgi:hypothetical protein